MIPRTAADARALIAGYEIDARRAREWAAIRRRDAEQHEARARRIDAEIAALRIMLLDLPEPSADLAQRTGDAA